MLPPRFARRFFCVAVTSARGKNLIRSVYTIFLSPQNWTQYNRSVSLSLSPAVVPYTVQNIRGLLWMTAVKIRTSRKNCKLFWTISLIMGILGLLPLFLKEKLQPISVQYTSFICKTIIVLLFPLFSIFSPPLCCDAYLISLLRTQTLAIHIYNPIYTVYTI